MDGRRYFQVSLVIGACLVFTLGLSNLASGHGLENIESVIDPNLSVPPGNEIQLFLYGVGVQKYKYNGSDWVFFNVSAGLYNFKGEKVGYHFLLPEEDANGGQVSWETFHPYSRVTCEPVVTVTEMNSISAILLKATSNVGSKLFGKTTFVQRVFPRNGLPPSSSYPARAGDEFWSDYSILYSFSRKSETH